MIKEKPKVIKIVKKKTVIVECHVLSKFTPECTWFKETKAVKEDSRHKVHVEQVKDVRYNKIFFHINEKELIQFVFVGRIYCEVRNRTSINC